jgi:hypothetical protein
MEPVADRSPGDDELLLAAYIGRNWEQHYRASFAAIHSGSGGAATFNRAAALVPMWFAWRGMLVIQLGAVIVYWQLCALAIIALDRVTADDSIFAVAMVLAYAVLGLIEGLAADRLLYHRARRAVRRAVAKSPDPAAALAGNQPGPGSVAMAAALPLLLVVVVVAVSPLFRHRHDPGLAYRAALRSDLRNLATHQESYFADHLVYTATPTDSFMSPMLNAWQSGYVASVGVTLTIHAASSTGWSATARHERSRWVCTIFVGDAPRSAEQAREGEPNCWLEDDR